MKVLTEEQKAQVMKLIDKIDEDEDVDGEDEDEDFLCKEDDNFLTEGDLIKFIFFDASV